MGEWKTYKLCEVANLSTGFPFDGHKYAKEGQRVVRGDNVTIGELRWDTDKDKRWNEPFARAEEFSLQEGDIVIGMDGSRVGRNRAQIKADDLPLLLAQRVACVRHNGKSLQKFLYYQIFSKNFENYIKSVHTGTSIPHVSLKQIGDFSFQVPDLSTQQRIAGILGSLDDKIELNRRINANLEAQAQALFRSWFVDFEPFRDGPFVDSELGKIPQGWKVGNLLDIAELFDYKRKPLSSREREKMQKIYPYYGATSIMDFVDNYIFDGIYLLMGEDGSVANAHGYPYLQYVFGKFWPNNHAHVMQGKNGYTTEMLHCLLLKKNITSIVTGAVQPKISQANMKKILVPLAPDKICSAFADLISPIYSTRRNSEKEISNLSALRDTLLPKLMAGEIKI